MLLRAPSVPIAAAFALVLVGATCGSPPAVPFAGELLGVASAHADDGDDGGGGSGGGAGDGGRGFDSRRGPSVGGWPKGRTFFDLFKKRQPRASRRKTPRRPPQALVQRAPGEIVALGLDGAAIAGLAASGFSVADRAAIGLVGAELVKLRVPTGTSLEAARAQVATVTPGAVVDFNHFYRPDQGTPEPCGRDQCLARHVVGWPMAHAMPARCTAPTRIGLIDTAINADHLAFVGGRIETIRLGSGDLPESGRQHGTAVAALLVGSTTSRAPGLLPGSELIAVDAFHRGNGEGDRSSAYDLVRAIDLLADRDVEVINMSLTGPANLLLEQVVEKATERDTVLVAAAGNDGPRAAPLYPGAYEKVIAVTAIDRRKQPYRRAGTGIHIDFAAPGVQVWTAASVKGAQSKTGTSFAAPFVTAAVAMTKAANPELNAGEIEELLRRTAEDLGTPGKDPVFGWGLLNVRAICES